MEPRKQTEIVFAMCLFIGHVYFTYIYSPVKDLWLRFKYRKEAAEVRKKYLKKNEDSTNN